MVISRRTKYLLPRLAFLGLITAWPFFASAAFTLGDLRNEIAAFRRALLGAPKEELQEVAGRFAGGFVNGQFARFVPNRVVVRLKGEEEFNLVSVADGETVDSAVKKFRGRSDVVYAEPDFEARALFVPDDRYYLTRQWNLGEAATGGISLERAWDVSKGEGVVVAVLDTGVVLVDGDRKPAPDFSGTVFVPGFDFVNNDVSPDDDNGHGTYIVGTIAEATDNGEGAAGIAFRAKIMPIKVLDKNGAGAYSDIARGIRFAADKGVKVIILPLGGPAPASYLEEALEYAYRRGAVIVAAAGNSGRRGILYPAAYDDYVIAVGASRFDRSLAGYSSFGEGLDIVAPGGDLYADQNGDGYGDGVLQQGFDPRTSSFGYFFYQGTSVAAAHVGGVAALVASAGKASTPNDIRAALLSTAYDLGPAGFDGTFGAGLVDASKAVRFDPVFDGSPRLSIVSPADGSVVSGKVALQMKVSGAAGIFAAEFLVDGVAAGGENTLWDSRGVADGNHTITAVVTGSSGRIAAASVGVVVANGNKPPLANAGQEKTALAGRWVSFDAGRSYDSDGSIVSYSWDFGDGYFAAGRKVGHRYLTAGRYPVTLTVTDNLGLNGVARTFVTVSEGR